ncbi:hypothetical protein KP509_10G031200 [Ceratopteris richardii]|nr:hypothetical protein KP509_10G031200 [Ceratopteris richardii]
MRAKEIFPDANSLICVLKACRIAGSVHKCEQIHNDIELWGLMERDLEVANTLVDTYAKLGLFLEAKQVLSALSSRDVVSWTVLISAYVDYEFSDGAFECYEQMQKEHIVPDVVTYVCMLKACNNPDALAKGELIHAEIEKLGMFESNLLVGKTLVDMYVKCHLIPRARQVFNRIMVQDVILWTSLIAGYAEHGPSEEALWCFERLQLQGLYPDAVTFVCSLKAAGCIGALDRGQEIHVEAERQGLLECNNVLGNALVDMYAKCGMLSMAQEVFSKLSVQDVVAWNALITGFVEHGPNNTAIMYFDKMQLEGIFPNAATYIWTLKACGDMGNIEKLRGIHAEIDRRGILEADLVVGSTLVDMYGKCGCLSQAVEVFDRLVDKDVLTWNALIAGYVECALYEQAIKRFDQMQDTGISPNAATYVCVLKACGNSGAADKGIELHRQLERHGLVESNLLVGNSLVDMYSKCGSISQACDVFNKLPVRDVISWTTVMSGYAQIGESKTVFCFFNNMLADGIMPNLITFLVLLSACSRTGLYHASKTFFEVMSQEYGIQPTLEHQNSLIDVLNRIGQLDNAISIIREMPFCPNIVVWRSMLGSCQKWGGATFAKGAFDHAVNLDERNAAVYVLMSHACIAKDIAVTNRSHC